MESTIHQAMEYHILTDKGSNRGKIFTTIQLKWKPPTTDNFKLNTNGSVKKKLGI